MICDRDAEILRISKDVGSDTHTRIKRLFQSDYRRGLIEIKFIYACLFETSLTHLKNVQEILKKSSVDELNKLILKMNIIPDKSESVIEIFKVIDMLSITQMTQSEVGEFLNMIISTMPIFFEPEKMIQEYTQPKNVYQQINLLIDQSTLFLNVYGPEIKNIGKKYIFSKLSYIENHKNHEDKSQEYIEELKSELKSYIGNRNIDLESELEIIRTSLDAEAKNLETFTDKNLSMS